jgi:ubiquinone/menaquinone biosynthesis C-methylase UbiE
MSKYIYVGVGFTPYDPERNEFMDLSNKHILDATCGSRTIWFQKQCPSAVYMDCREEHDTAIWKSTKNNSVRTLDVEPDVVADFTDMPFPGNTFNLVVFDPPHLVKVGETAWLKKKYGKLPDNWQKLIHDGFLECMRVLKPFGTLIFKWSEIDIPTRDIINAIGVEPLFGHRSGKAMKTHWLCFMKESDT